MIGHLLYAAIGSFAKRQIQLYLLKLRYKISSRKKKDKRKTTLKIRGTSLKMNLNIICLHVYVLLENLKTKKISIISYSAVSTDMTNGRKMCLQGQETTSENIL